MQNGRIVVAGLGLVAAAALIILLAAISGGDGAPALGPAPTAGPSSTPFAFAAAVSSPTPVPATASPTPRPVPECGPSLTPAFMEANQVVSYYGNPYSADMGILGELDPETLAAEVTAHAAAYDALNGDRGVLPALHIVYATAQASPGREGTYLLHVDEKTMLEYIDLACRNALLVFVDLQIGLSDVATEVELALPYLEYPNVHLALDPEFAMPPGEVPGEKIGTLDATDVNLAQAMLQGFIDERGLGDKMLVVHQFLDTMITRRELLERQPGVRLAVDMDGFGPAEIKTVKYGWYAAPADYAGIKLFFKHDPDLMSESEVLGLEPDVIIYQ